MAENGWNGWKWLQMLEMAENDCKLLKKAGNGWNICTAVRL